MALIGTDEEVLVLEDTVEVDEDEEILSDEAEDNIIEEPDDDSSIPDVDEDDGSAGSDTSAIVMELDDVVEVDSDDIISDEEDEVLDEPAVAVEDEPVTPIDDNIIEVPTIASVQEGERVMVAIVDGEATVIGAAGSGDNAAEDINAISAEVGTFGTLIAGKAEIADLEAANAKITNLEADYADLDTLVAQKAAITDLNAATARIGELETEYTTVNGTLSAHTAVINNLDNAYAHIDFGNLTDASIQNLYLKSGFVTDIQVEDGKFTGKLTALQIDAGDITTGTLAADRLVIKGNDGLYYALNVSTLGTAYISSLSQEEQEKLKNGIHGDNIIAKTITASKIAVNDLQAFNATIGGWDIETNAIHTRGKTAYNTGTGTWLGADGSFGIGSDQEHITYDPVTGDMDIKVKNLSIETGSTYSAVVTEKSLEEALDGYEGAQGKSAYEVAVANGFTGTEAEWLASLKGEKGDTGATGPRGATGPTGPTGGTGAAGKDAQGYYGACSTSAGDNAKVAYISQYSVYPSLKAGLIVNIYMTYANTAVNPTLTLRVGNTSSYNTLCTTVAIFTNGVSYAYWPAGTTVTLVYTGSQWYVANNPVYASTVTIGNPGGQRIFLDSNSQTFYDSDGVDNMKFTSGGFKYLNGSTADSSGMLELGKAYFGSTRYGQGLTISGVGSEMGVNGVNAGYVMAGSNDRFGSAGLANDASLELAAYGAKGYDSINISSSSAGHYLTAALGGYSQLRIDGSKRSVGQILMVNNANTGFVPAAFPTVAKNKGGTGITNIMAYASENGGTNVSVAAETWTNLVKLTVPAGRGLLIGKISFSGNASGGTLRQFVTEDTLATTKSNAPSADVNSLRTITTEIPASTSTYNTSLLVAPYNNSASTVLYQHVYAKNAVTVRNHQFYYIPISA